MKKIKVLLSILQVKQIFIIIDKQYSLRGIPVGRIRGIRIFLLFKERQHLCKRKETILKGPPHQERTCWLAEHTSVEFGEEIGKTVETMVQEHVSRLAETWIGRPKSYYWKNKKEVDIVIEPSFIPVPLEVKYRQNPDDVSGVREFMKEFGSPFGIVVTKDTLKLVDEVVFIPLALFLLIC